MKRRIIICGSRSWEDYQTMRSVIQGLEPGEDIVVHGGAHGADQMAGEIAVELGLEVEVHPADWEKHGKGAGFIRNEQMALLGADACIAFWDGESRGTADMMQRASEHGIKVAIVRGK